MSASASATAHFEGDDSSLSAAINRIEGRVSGLAGKLAAFGLAFQGIKLAGDLVASAFDHLREAMELGGTLADLQSNTGVAANDMMRLRQEFANAGKSADDVEPAFTKMYKALESGSADSTLAQLGVDLDAIRKKSPADQFHQIGAALAKIENPAARSAAAMEVFGKTGASLQAVFDADGAGQAADEVGEQAEILMRDCNLFDDVSDKLNLVGLKVQGFWVGVADKVAPVLKPLLDKFASLDLAEWGQQAGQIIAFIVQGLGDGTLVDILFTSAQLGLGKAINLLGGMVAAIGNGLWGILAAAVKGAIGLFGVLTTGDFWKGMGQALLGIAESFVALLLDGIAQLLHYASMIPGAGGLEDTSQATAKVAETIRSAGAEHRKEPSKIFDAYLQHAGEAVSAAISQFVDSAAKGYEAGSKIIDVDALTAKLEGKIGKTWNMMMEVSNKALEDDPNKGPKKPGGELAEGHAAVTALQRIGGAMGSTGGGGDPLLTESKQQTGLHRKIEGHLAKLVEHSVGGAASGQLILG